MGERELREKYGGKLAKAINRAIRAEIPGGNEALDKLTALAGPALHSGWKDPKGLPTLEAAAFFKHRRDVVEKMDAQVRRTWDVPPDREANPSAGPARNGKPKRAPRPARPARPRAGAPTAKGRKPNARPKR